MCAVRKGTTGTVAALTLLLSAGGTAHADVISDLQSLEAQSQTLVVHDVIGSFSESTMAGAEVLPVAQVSFQQHSPPAEGAAAASLLGSAATSERRIGNITYVRLSASDRRHVPGFNREFPGRTWLRLTDAELTGAGLLINQPLPALNPTAPNLFAPTGIAGLVAIATGLAEPSPSQFTGTVDSTAFAKLANVTLFGVNDHTPLALTFTIQPNGLLSQVAVSAQLSAGGTASATSVVSSITTPVTVTAPPARQTVDYRRLSRSQRADLAQS